MTAATMRERVLHITYANPGAYPPIQNSAQILAEAGCDVLVLGIETRGTERIVLEARPRIVIKQLSSCAPGWRQKLHYLGFALWCLYWAVRWRPSWIYASDAFSCPAALAAAFGRFSKLIYHEHDEPLRPSSTRRESSFMRFIGFTRGIVARRASLCVVPQKERLRTFVDTSRRQGPVACVWNCPRRAHAFVEHERSRSFTVLYHGSIVPERLPRSVITALGELPADVRLRISGYETIGHLGYIAELQTLAAQLGLSDRVEFLPPMGHRELYANARACHVGLALMPRQSIDANLQHMVGASNKPFDYMACGLPLVVSDIPEWLEMYVDAGFARACDPENAESIARALRLYIDQPELVASIGERARRHIATEWNYESQFEPVIRHMLLQTGARRKRATAQQAFSYSYDEHTRRPFSR